MDKIKIAHITSVHRHNDTRIFLKQCISLSKHYEVHLINKEYTGIKNNIIFRKANFLKKPILRIITSWIIALYNTIGYGYKSIQFHDPELIFAAPIWRLFGIKVIYDVHENYSRQLETKDYIPNIFKFLIKILIISTEKIYSLMVNKIIIVHKDLNPNLNKLKKHDVISNAPLTNYKFKYRERTKQFCYIGLISKQRGLVHIAKALNKLNIKFIIAGVFANEIIKKELLDLENVEYIGYIDDTEKIELISKSLCGCCTFLPIDHHLISNPNKIYEYLNYGTPVICSNFKAYKEVIPNSMQFIHYCNIENEEETINTIKKIIKFDDKTINHHGELGHNFINENYNWNFEEKKLIKIYYNLLN